MLYCSILLTNMDKTNKVVELHSHWPERQATLVGYTWIIPQVHKNNRTNFIFEKRHVNLAKKVIYIVQFDEVRWSVSKFSSLTQHRWHKHSFKHLRGTRKVVISVFIQMWKNNRIQANAVNLMDTWKCQLSEKHQDKLHNSNGETWMSKPQSVQ